jgi:hypothetical protein
MSSPIYSKLVLPFIRQFTCDTVLLTGEAANTLEKELNNSRSYTLYSPFQLDQLQALPQFDLAIVSDLIEMTPKKQATEWLGMLKNGHCQHIILIIETTQLAQSDWQLADFLALGFKLSLKDEHTVFSYNIKDYQFKKDWLNSRFWANPENFDKYRW